MKSKIAATLLALVAAFTTREAQADVVWLETFNYTNGAISVTSTNGAVPPSITNWITHSGAIDAFVNNRRLQVSSSSVNGGLTSTRTGDVNRQFSTTNNSVLTNAHQLMYASFIVNFTNLPTVNGAYFAHFKAGTPLSSTFQGRLWALIGNPLQTSNNFTALPNTFRLGVSAGGNSPSSTFGMDLALNTDYQVVLGWDPVNLIALSLWVNPVSSADSSVTSSDSFTPTAANVVNSFAFRQATGFGGFLTVSNLTVATTFLEALTNTLSTNAVAPRIVYQPVGVTNFVNTAIALSAVANGQGQAGLTYQWFLSNSVSGFLPYTNPNGNTNVLSFPSAQATDSGAYRLVVTTPYGLSATSAVARVLISAQPGPPTFVTQPVSQSVYALQNVTFSCSVLSPGNVTYQWFSNNVAILGANQSSLLLPAIDPSYAANYRVAVTNDTWPTGIVSTNAALTVRVPAAVSIGFLRTLVDTNTFLVTNTPPTIAYSVTGIVTTFTNITVGNTSSYYLQDATGGINIFVTGGQTFRPQLGDVVNFVGVLSSFSSGIELYADATATPVFPYTSFTVLSNNIAGLPAPLPIPFTIMTNIANANYNLGARYVQISDVFFGARAGTTISTTANDTVTVTNSQGQIFRLFFPFLSQEVAGQTLPSYAFNINGILYSQNSTVTNTLLVTRFSDIITNNPTPTPIPIVFNQAGGLLVLSWTNASFSLQYSTNLTGPYVTIPGATSPYTNLTGTNAAGFFRLKF